MDEEGLMMYILRPKSIKKEDHWYLLKEFRRRLGHNREVAFFYDGLHFHHNKAAMALMEKLKFYPLQNVAYSCQYNPIEQIWKEVKQPLPRARGCTPKAC